MERLVNMLARAGMRVQLTLTRADRRRQGGPHKQLDSRASVLSQSP
jgi:hypothetical protein